ncbi:sulfotransferase 1B1-like [Dermacentor andersoni]|uniref:sulfotransferase 1B1-like n=1 Tax=Dermacentor andersoni TaxID=34620 RepID=UPI003B3B5360
MRLLGIRSRKRADDGSLCQLTLNVDEADDQFEEPATPPSATLPGPTGPVELAYVVDGLPVPQKAFNVEVVRDALRYQARPSDVFVATYPKTGTTWTQYIVWMLLNLDRLDEGVPLFTDIVTRHVPFLERVGRKVAEALPEPRIIKHHLPFWLSPYHPLAKYVVAVRNPFDCVVSFYHHCRAEPSMGLRPGTTFDEFFEQFLEARVPFGSYFDHVLSWYARRDDSNVFFFYYETLKQRPATVTLEIADFLDAAAAARLRGDERLLRYVVDKTSIGSLKTSHFSAGPTRRGAGTPRPKAKEPLDKLSANHFRMGEVGEWKRHIKPDQARRLRQLCEERISGTKMWYTWQKWME